MLNDYKVKMCQTSKGHIALLKGVIVNKVKIRLSKEECEILQGCP